MPGNPSLSRRDWLAMSLSAGGCLASGNFALAQSDAPAPPGYTVPGSVADHGKAPGMQIREVSVQPNGETTYAVIFAKGDEVLSGLTEFATLKKITAGHFTAIGALKQAKFGWFDAEKKAYLNIPVDQQAELVSLIGDVGIFNGKPQVHAHGSVGLRDGTLRGGHLLEAIVWPTVEVFFTALPLALAKERDDETGLALFRLNASP